MCMFCIVLNLWKAWRWLGYKPSINKYLWSTLIHFFCACASSSWFFVNTAREALVLNEAGFMTAFCYNVAYSHRQSKLSWLTLDCAELFCTLTVCVQSLSCHNKTTSDFTFVGCSSLIATAGHSSESKNVCLWDTLLPPRSALVHGEVTQHIVDTH